MEQFNTLPPTTTLGDELGLNGHESSNRKTLLPRVRGSRCPTPAQTSTSASSARSTSQSDTPTTTRTDPIFGIYRHDLLVLEKVMAQKELIINYDEFVAFKLQNMVLIQFIVKYLQSKKQGTMYDIVNAQPAFSRIHHPIWQGCFYRLLRCGVIQRVRSIGIPAHIPLGHSRAMFRIAEMSSTK